MHTTENNLKNVPEYYGLYPTVFLSAEHQQQHQREQQQQQPGQPQPRQQQQRRHQPQPGTRFTYKYNNISSEIQLLLLNSREFFKE